MQEALVFTPSQSRLGALAPTARSPQLSSSISEAADDLAELLHLVGDLNESICDDETGWSDTSSRKTIQLLKAKYKRYLELIERTRHWGKSQELTSLLQTIREEYVSIKSALQLAYRKRGTTMCLSDWQSPSYLQSVPMGNNRLSEGTSEHAWNYKRDGHLDALDYERAFIQEYAEHLQSQRLNSYLANSHMAALTTVLQWLAHEVELGKDALVLHPVQLETLKLTQAFFPNAQELKASGCDEILAYLRKENPTLLLCEAINNTQEIVASKISVALKWACNEATQPIALVLDTSSLPVALFPERMLSDLPEHVSVLFVEDLVRHHQFGLDTVSGGMIVADMSCELQESFRLSRARIGTNVTDTSVGSLPKPNRQRLLSRLCRHSNNVKMLSTQLEAAANQPAAVIRSVSWLDCGSNVCPSFHGSALTVRLHRAFRSVNYYRQFCARLIESAKAQNLHLSSRPDFGFDATSICVTMPGDMTAEPCLTIAVGTETSAEVESLIELFSQVGDELKQLHGGASAIARMMPKPRLVLDGEEPIARSEQMRASVFFGEDGLHKYLSPEHYPPTPLVELPKALNPFYGDGVRLMAKMMPLVPLMNIKSIPAFSMLNKANERGDLEGVNNIIESSSSNTVLSLSVIGKLFGIENTSAIVDHSIAPSLVRMLRLFGIEILLHPAAGHELFGKMEPRSQRATDAGRQPGWFNPGQYSNQDNPEGFARWLAPHLWEQTGGRLSVLALALGTCGTMVGVGQALRDRNPDIEIVACCPQSGHAVPGPREQSLLHDVSFDWRQLVSEYVELTSVESFAASVQLIRRGIMGGPSSGMNYAGALRYLAREKESGRLQDKVQSQGELWCTFMCCDSPLPHVDEYFDALGDDFFPAIHDVPKACPSKP